MPSRKKGKGFEAADTDQTASAFQEQALFYKRLFENKEKFEVWVIAAGIGAILEGFHIFWLFFLWIWGRLPR